MQILLFVLTIILVAIGGYYLTCHIIKLWTGCTTQEAVTRLHNFLSGKAHYSFENDIGFANAVWDSVRNIIGVKRFQQLCDLSNTIINPPLLAFGYESGLPYIVISLFYIDDNEKHRLETVLTNLVKDYLRKFGYNEAILVDWKTRYDLNMPYLEIRYARISEEQHILSYSLNCIRQNIITVNNAVIDTEDEEDLDGK